MKPSSRTILPIVLLVALLIVCIPVFAQEAELIENFDDPALPGWERSEGVIVEDGILHMPPESFTHRGQPVGDCTLRIRLKYAGDGDLVITYLASDQNAYHAVLSTEFVVIQREHAGEVRALGQVEFIFPEGEWFEISLSVTDVEHTLTVDGQSVLVVSTEDSVPPGGFGFETLGDIALEVDELTLTYKEEMHPEETEAPAEDTEIVVETGELTWVYTGGPVGGLGYDIRMDPRNPDVMYVTDAWAGAFKSTDGGENWFPINSGITSRVGPSGDGIPVFCLTIDPNNPDTLWAGTQFQGSIFRSDDAGESWRSMSNGIQERALTIRSVSVEPGNSDVVYLGGEISSWEWNETPLPGLGLDMTKGVVYKSTDGGQYWKRIWYGDNLTRYILIHPQDTNLIYVSTGIFDREAANSNPETLDPGGVGILRSRDGGQTWQVLDTENGFQPYELYFGSLSMHPENPDILLAAAGNDPYLWKLGSPLGAIYRTEDGGDNWTRVLGLDNASAVEICEGNPDVVYAGSMHGLYRSDDSGHEWQQLAGMEWGSPDIVAGFPIDMQCDPRDDQRIFINNYNGGNFLSEDGGQNWLDASRGYTGSLMKQVVVANDSPLRVYVTARSGVFRSDDGGQTWQGLAHGPARALEAYGIAVDPIDSQHVIAVIGDAGPIPKISKDGGQTWHEADFRRMMDAASQGGQALQIAFSPLDAQRVIAIPGDYDCWSTGGCEQGYGVMISTDGGESWGLTDIDQETGVDIEFSEDGTAYVAVYPGSIYRSEDGGESWQSVAQDLSDRIEIVNDDADSPRPSLTAIAVDRQDPQRLYAGFFLGGVMISQDGGETWEDSSAGLNPETTVRDIVVDAAHPGTVYLATHESGVYRSSDSGVTWQAINDGLLTRAGVDLAISNDGNILYLASEGAGVFRLSVRGEDYFETIEPVSTPSESVEEEQAIEAAVPISTPADPSQAPKGFPIAIVVALGVVIVVLVVVFAVRKRAQSA